MEFLLPEEPPVWEPCAKWESAPQGKWDYDGRLISISCRYWPPNYSRSGKLHSAEASLMLNHGTPDQHGFGLSTPLAQRSFEGETEEEVKKAVEEWVESRCQRALRLAIAGLRMTE